MRKIIVAAAAAGLLAGPFAAATASPQEDLEDFRAYFQEKFPDVEFEEYKNGVYAIDADRRMQWEAQEEFPSYMPGVDKGEELYDEHADVYRQCFGGDAPAVKTDFPRWDAENERVLTLELAINECRENAGLEPYGWKKGNLAALSAYIGYESRGDVIDVEIPTAAAEAAYEDGKQFFYAKRGQLNLACANCHVDSAGQRARANTLSPALGHPTHFPVYRKKWEARGDGDLAGFGTMHRRYGGCNRNIRAKPFAAQSEEYRNLEYFQNYMSNGLEVNAPGTRE